MPDSAELLLVDGDVHTMGDVDEVTEAIAVSDGEIVRVGSTSHVRELEGPDTDVVELNGRTLLPGFIDAHSHLDVTSRYVKYADLRLATSLTEYLDVLAESGDVRDDEWIVGYDRNTWKKMEMDGSRVVGFDFDDRIWDRDDRVKVDRHDLDRVSETRPVAVFRDDMRFALVNSVVLDYFAEELSGHLRRDAAGEPTGVVDGPAVETLHRRIEPDVAAMQDLLEIGQEYANSIGVTGVHDFVRHSNSPAAYRLLDLADQLTLRVRLNYWTPHLDQIEGVGLRTNHGSDFVEMGGIKFAMDGSLGGGSALLSEPYSDAPDDDPTYRGTLRMTDEELHETVRRIDELGLQITVHSMGDEATERLLTAYEEETEKPGAVRHRIEHAELLTSGQIDRFSELGVVASVQPNFLKWMGEGGLYDRRIGPERRRAANPFAGLRERDVPLAFGSDKMPFGPLFGIHQAVNAPTDAQRLSVTEAVRAYTTGAAYAGFDENRFGTVEPGTAADVVVLDRSPWEHPTAIRDIDISLTVVDGTVVHQT